VIRPLLAIVLLSGCQPAYAATYGPPAPVTEAPRSVTERQSFELLPGETMEDAELRIKRDTGTAWTRFWIAQGLAATDVALTCVILAKGGREANPIYGKNATCGRIAAIRGGLSVVQYLLTRRTIERDPAKAKKGMLISVGFAGLPVVWNIAQLAK